MLGTLSLVTGRPMQMDTVLPDWLENGVESSLRDTEEEAAPAPLAPQPIAGAQLNKGVVMPVVLTPSGGSSPVGSQGRVGASGSGAKGPWMDLDKFYAESEEEEEEEGDGEDDDDDEESGEEDEDVEEHSTSEEDSEDDHDKSEEANHPNSTEERAFAARAYLEPS
jgi:AP-3 complex subunit beta